MHRENWMEIYQKINGDNLWVWGLRVTFFFMSFSILKLPLMSIDYFVKWEKRDYKEDLEKLLEG